MGGAENDKRFKLQRIKPVLKQARPSSSHMITECFSCFLKNRNGDKVVSITLQRWCQPNKSNIHVEKKNYFRQYLG